MKNLQNEHRLLRKNTGKTFIVDSVVCHYHCFTVYKIQPIRFPHFHCNEHVRQLITTMEEQQTANSIEKYIDFKVHHSFNFYHFFGLQIFFLFLQLCYSQWMHYKGTMTKFCCIVPIQVGLCNNRNHFEWNIEQKILSTYSFAFILLMFKSIHNIRLQNNFKQIWTYSKQWLPMNVRRTSFTSFDLWCFIYQSEYKTNFIKNATSPFIDDTSTFFLWFFFYKQFSEIGWQNEAVTWVSHLLQNVSGIMLTTHVSYVHWKWNISNWKAKIPTSKNSP